MNSTPMMFQVGNYGEYTSEAEAFIEKIYDGNQELSEWKGLWNTINVFVNNIITLVLSLLRKSGEDIKMLQKFLR